MILYVVVCIKHSHFIYTYDELSLSSGHKILKTILTSLTSEYSDVVSYIVAFTLLTTEYNIDFVILNGFYKHVINLPSRMILVNR